MKAAVKLNALQLAVLRRVATGGADGLPVGDLDSAERCSAWALSHRNLVEMGLRGVRVWRITSAGREALAAAELAAARTASVETERQRLAAGDRP